MTTMIKERPPPAAHAVYRGMTADSRQVGAGFLFAALPGTLTDGRSFIADAVAKGAVAILAPTGTTLPPGIGSGSEPVTLITDDNPRRRFARMVAEFYGRQPDVIAAVTGTNGKTSTTHFLRQIWQHAGRRAASLGTLGLTAPGGDVAGALTTPDPVVLHGHLAGLAEDGVTHLAMEASSHGLDQHRLDGVRVALAGFTNLSRDHLDYHGTMPAYLAAKTRLFVEILVPGGTAVLNADSPATASIAREATDARRVVMTFGRAGRDVRVDTVEATADGLDLSLSVRHRRHHVTVPLVGLFQVENAACALGLALASGVADDDAVAALGRFKGVRGRLELAGHHGSGAPIYVDYAHTPEALETMLHALRPHTKGRLHIVFGAGGDRDRGKRPEMGAVANRLADSVIVTDDNPRSEDPATIRAAIMLACPQAREIGDRADAIAEAVGSLMPGDVLVIAGKGHESGQIVGDRVHPFDDAQQARAVIGAPEKAAEPGVDPGSAA